MGAQNLVPNVAATQGVAPTCGPCLSQGPKMWLQIWLRLRGSPPNVGLVPVSGNKCAFKCGSHSGEGSLMWALSQSVETHLLSNVAAIQGRLLKATLIPVSHQTCGSKCGLPCRESLTCGPCGAVIVCREIDGGGCSNRTCSAYHLL